MSEHKESPAAISPSGAWSFTSGEVHALPGVVLQAATLLIHNAGASVTEPAEIDDAVQQQGSDPAAFGNGSLRQPASIAEPMLRAGADVEGPSEPAGFDPDAMSCRYNVPRAPATQEAPSAPAEPLRALAWLASAARSHDATFAHEANINDCEKVVRAALSVSTSAPKETSEPRAHNRQHAFTPPNPDYCAICGYDEPDICHVATPEPAEPREETKP